MGSSKLKQKTLLPWLLSLYNERGRAKTRTACRVPFWFWRCFIEDDPCRGGAIDSRSHVCSDYILTLLTGWISSLAPKAMRVWGGSKLKECFRSFSKSFFESKAMTRPTQRPRVHVGLVEWKPEILRKSRKSFVYLLGRRFNFLLTEDLTQLFRKELKNNYLLRFTSISTVDYFDWILLSVFTVCSMTGILVVLLSWCLHPREVQGKTTAC